MGKVSTALLTSPTTHVWQKSLGNISYLETILTLGNNIYLKTLLTWKNDFSLGNIDTNLKKLQSTWKHDF